MYQPLSRQILWINRVVVTKVKINSNFTFIIYFLEFKINSDGETALQQIKTKKYANAYTADNRTKIGIGINFNVQSRELDGWEEAVL